MSENKARGPMMGGHRSRAMNSGEKAKDFKGAMKRLLKYMERYKIRFVLMFLFAIAGTIFNIVGPKILPDDHSNLHYAPKGKRGSRPNL